MFTILKKLFQRLLNRPMDVEATAVQQPVPAIPYDENLKSTYVPMIAIVDGSGNITGYLPLAAEDNGDGTASIKVTN